MAKFKEKIKARESRCQGESIKEIAKKLKVSKGSVSIWCRDIELTPKQIEKLQKRMLVGSYQGRIKGARVQRERRLQEISKLQTEGLKLVEQFSKRDFLLAGAGLYLGDGTKQKMTRITNSDPEIVKFVISWFKIVWGISKERFTLQVLINEIHKHRVSWVEKYWSKITGIPLCQFGKTTLIKAKNKKVYKNFNNHYGTIVVTVRKGGDLHHRIQGLTSNILKEGCNFDKAT